jgi:hypothetical protein
MRLTVPEPVCLAPLAAIAKLYDALFAMALISGQVRTTG